MNYAEIEALSARIMNENIFIQKMKGEIGKVVIGQERMIDRILMAFLSDGHILLEGMPGLAKTLTVRAFAKCIDAEFQRIQFTPDLLPADLIGTRIYNPRDMDFFTRRGPLFTNILLADEINRAPAKVQSALLQCMEERAVTIGEETHELQRPFMVLATENPIEQEGTYPLPEAQIDRFFMKCIVEYPAPEEEKEILRRHESASVDDLETIISPADMAMKAELVSGIYIDEKIIDYIVNLVGETRAPKNTAARRFIEYGASPRASIALMKAGRCSAFIRGRGYVTPDDIKEIGRDVLRHRIILSYEAEAEGIKPDDAVAMVFDSVEVP